jgi:glutamate/tyrosine decarboxylase-like PLP-dependent enzyme
MHAPPLLLEPGLRAELWERLIRAIEGYSTKVDSARVTPELNPEKIRSLLAPFDFAKPVGANQAVDFVVEALSKFQTHTPHPRYFGLFNPAPTTMGIVADALVAAFNPQLAAWSHSPFAIEVERHLVLAFGRRFGFEQAEGVFASGGAEANHTALLTAMAHAFPEFAQEGLRALSSQPALYISTEGHHSFHKAARLSGLGTGAVREIPVDDRLRFDADSLLQRLRQDRREGFAPFMLVATAGTTNAGIVDPLRRLAEIASEEGLWYHVDASWGGAAALVPELRPLLDGIERADSITFDAHKWLSVPMGAGIYLTRHRDILDKTFRVAAPYMPREAAGLAVVDPCLSSMQWSRRFIGLKVFMSLLVAGWDGYAAALRHMAAMGDKLRQELEVAHWEVVNDTALPLVCFRDKSHSLGQSAPYLDRIALEIVASGKAWINTTRLAGSIPALRACVTNYRTSPADISALVDALNWARDRVKA